VTVLVAASIVVDCQRTWFFVFLVVARAAKYAGETNGGPLAMALMAGNEENVPTVDEY
jgi:hypothetical protein